MDSALAPCPACDRHVRTDEASCPFCAAPLPGDLAGGAVPPAPRRLGRAAAFAFGVITLGAAACGARSELPGSAVAGSSGSGGTGGSGGGTATSSTSSATSSAATGCGICPPYGTPGFPIEDAGAPDDGG